MKTTNIKHADIYTDGSYSNKLKYYSYGFVIVVNNQELFSGSGHGNNPRTVDMRNVAGEILAVIKAIQKAQEMKIPKITIIHDYNGIGFWADNKWKTNKEGTKFYKEFVRRSRETMEINFQWVKGHSGNEFNEVADRLAASAMEKIKYEEEVVQDVIKNMPSKLIK